MKRFAVLLLIAGAALVAAWNLSNPAPLAEGSSSAQLFQPGPYQVVNEKLTLIDRSRPTQANGDFAGENQRILPARIWYPAQGGAVAAGRFPLIVYSHGFFSSRDEPAYLGEFLASHGYVLIAATFPLTNMRAPGGPNLFDVVNQPRDVSFLIDSVLGWSQEKDNRFYGRIDPDRIGIAGLSLGGMTTELTAYHPRIGDVRVKAGVSLAGPLDLLGRRFFETSQLPFMMIAGDIDAMVPYIDNARPVLERVNNAWLVSLHGASHTGFADAASMLRWLDNPDSIGCFLIAGKVPRDLQNSRFFDSIGSEEEGVLRGMKNKLCQMKPLPKAMSPLLQHRIVTLAVFAFFESVFNPDQQTRENRRDYLANILAKELPDVRVERSTPKA